MSALGGAWARGSFTVSADWWGQAWLPAVPVSDRELLFTHADSQSCLWPTVDTAWAALGGDSDMHVKAEWGQGEKAGSQEEGGPVGAQLEGSQ